MRKRQRNIYRKIHTSSREHASLGYFLLGFRFWGVFFFKNGRNSLRLLPEELHQLQAMQNLTPHARRVWESPKRRLKEQQTPQRGFGTARKKKNFPGITVPEVYRKKGSSKV